YEFTRCLEFRRVLFRSLPEAARLFASLVNPHQHNSLPTMEVCGACCTGADSPMMRIVSPPRGGGGGCSWTSNSGSRYLSYMAISFAPRVHRSRRKSAQTSAALVAARIRKGA